MRYFYEDFYENCWVFVFADDAKKEDLPLYVYMEGRHTSPGPNEELEFILKRTEHRYEECRVREITEVEALARMI